MTLYLSRITGPARATYGDTVITLPDAARDCERETCPSCGREHDALWRVTRRVVGTLGHFAIFRLNGGRIVPDLSVPYSVERLPRDAVRLTPAEAARIWHDDNESHVLGGPNVAAALRATIARANIERRQGS